MTTAVKDAGAAAGRNARRRGHDRMRICVEYLRKNYWPNASVETRHYLADIHGIWDDLALEITVVAWDNIDGKVNQAKRDAEKRGCTVWAVWKHRKGRQPGGDYMITDAKVFLDLAAAVEDADNREAALRRELASVRQQLDIYERITPGRAAS